MTRPSAPSVEPLFSLAFYFRCICRGGLGLLSFRQGRRCVENRGSRLPAGCAQRFKTLGWWCKQTDGRRSSPRLLLSPVRPVR